MDVNGYGNVIWGFVVKIYELGMTIGILIETSLAVEVEKLFVPILFLCKIAAAEEKTNEILILWAK